MQEIQLSGFCPASLQNCYLGGKDIITNGLLLTLKCRCFSCRGSQQSSARRVSETLECLSLLSWAALLELRALSGAAEGSGSHGWRVGRGRAARLGAHRSRVWRRLQRAEGLRGSWWCWEQTSDLAPASPNVPRSVLREQSEDLRDGRKLGAAGAGRAAAGGVPGHRLEAAQRHRTARIPQRCQDLRASDPARLPAPSPQAGALRSEPGSLQPAKPLASPSGSPPLLRLLTVVGWGERLSVRRPRLPQHGGRSARLGLRLGQQRPPPPARPRAGAPVCALRLAGLERGSEGEPRVGAAGTTRTPAQPRASC